MPWKRGNGSIVDAPKLMSFSPLTQLFLLLLLLPLLLFRKR